MEGGSIPSTPEEGPQAVGPAAAGESGGTEGAARHEVPASDHGERLFAGGADVGPEERASTAGSPFAFEGDKVAAGGLGTEQTGAELPPLEGLEQTFAGGIADRDDQEEALRPGHLRTFRDADPSEAARVPQQPSGLEEPFEDSSFKGV
ncbi:hypothetical protein COHA_009167 [Chlorella ohadii]|uniref:Uncharacterized protein n=1 Tax=Chlorella ohadii TaxID=2649997 RepID=A0AAD5DK19_9CHLO|nr:hypothetical protein COHA_009167 [Chlorella ohadii]